MRWRAVARRRARETATVYREQRGMRSDDPAIAVLVQQLVQSDTSAVVFSANPINGRRDEVLINASWGLGESIVGGTVTPDSFVVRRPEFRIVERTTSMKDRMTVSGAGRHARGAGAALHARAALADGL